MANPYLGEIRIFGFNFAPQGWAECDGQILAISQNTALFSLLGTTYGGNGQSTFALPDLQGRVPIHEGQGAGLSNYVQGQIAGEESTTLTLGQLPSHNHQVNGVGANGNSKTAANNLPGNVQGTNTNVYSNAAASTTMNPTMIGAAGGSQPHNNLQPYLVLMFCISLVGIFPARS